MSFRIFAFLVFSVCIAQLWAQKVHLERAKFSTKWEDYGPRLVAGKLYCLSASFDGDSTMNDPYTFLPFSDVYLVKDSVLEHATFATHRFGDSTSMSSNFYDGPLSGNENIMFFTNNHGKEHNVRLGVFYAFKIENKWTDALVFPFNSLEYNVSHPFYDQKNGKLYFVSDKGSVEENQDIYVCSFDGKYFGVPAKVEATCSAFNEISPLVYNDILYFASNGFGSTGCYDLFKLEDGNVVSMGPEFNTDFDELTLMFDSDSSGYFASDRYSYGADDDIVRFVIIKERIEPEVNPVVQSLPISVSTNEDALQKLIAAKKNVDELKLKALQAGVSPDLFAFLNLALAQYEKNFPATYADKPVAELNNKTAELQTMAGLIEQQIAALKPKQSTIIAINDLAKTEQNMPVDIDILQNDKDPQGIMDRKSVDLDPNTPGLQKQMTTPQGKWVVQNDILNFEPALGFTGKASLPYTVKDQKGNPSQPALVTIEVQQKYARPVANNDQAKTNVNQPIQLMVAANDSCPDSPLDLSSIDLDPTSPGLQTQLNTPQGIWTVKEGKLTLVPTTNFKGMAYIPYSIKSSAGVESNVATVTVYVGDGLGATPLNAPIANNDLAQTPVNTPLRINPIQNDQDPQGQLNAASIDLNPNLPGLQAKITTPQGTWAATPDGKVDFIPVADFSGTAAIPYTVQNNAGLTSNVAMMAVQVNIPESKNIEPNQMSLETVNAIIDQSKIENIHFDFDSYRITPEYQTYMRGLSMLFNANPAWQIHLSGHTDSMGTAGYNIVLSKNRSIATKKFLISCGIAPERITYEYHGESKPITSNSTPEGRYQNRRVEFTVYLNGKSVFD